ncbi:MAG: 2'-5' RNA ligase family protein [Anaerolineae bacterium]
MSANVTAVDLMPTREIACYADRFRRQYARQHFGRVPPHVTLVYPFVPFDDLQDAYHVLGQVCLETSVLRLRVTGFGVFEATLRLYLRVEPAEVLQDLQLKLLARFPHCQPAHQRYGGLVPHITVGYFRDREELYAAFEPLQATRLNHTFVADALHITYGNETSVWRTARTVPLACGNSSDRVD